MELLTISEIAKKLNHPESTVRYWRNKYDAFIPSVGSGRRKRYRPDAVQVFAAIAQLSAEELPSEDIAERLTAEFPRSIEYSSNNSSNVSTMAIYTPTAALQHMIEGQDLLIRALAELTARQTETDDMRREIRELRQIVEDQNLFCSKEQNKPPSTPWYKRIGRKTRQDAKADAPEADQPQPTATGKDI